MRILFGRHRLWEQTTYDPVAAGGRRQPIFYVQIMRPFRKYVESKFKQCFPIHWDIWNNSPAGSLCKQKRFLVPPPPPIVQLPFTRILGWLRALKPLWFKWTMHELWAWYTRCQCSFLVKCVLQQNVCFPEYVESRTRTTNHEQLIRVPETSSLLRHFGLGAPW